MNVHDRMFSQMSKRVKRQMEICATTRCGVTLGLMTEAKNPVWLRIEDLMRKAGETSLLKVCQTSGASYNAVAKLKSRPTQQISGSNAQKLAAHFKVSENFLLYGDIDTEGMTLDERRIILFLRSLPPEAREAWVRALEATASLATQS